MFLQLLTLLLLHHQLIEGRFSDTTATEYFGSGGEDGISVATTFALVNGAVGVSGSPSFNTNNGRIQVFPGKFIDPNPIASITVSDNVGAARFGSAVDISEYYNVVGGGPDDDSKKGAIWVSDLSVTFALSVPFLATVTSQQKIVSGQNTAIGFGSSVTINFHGNITCAGAPLVSPGSVFCFTKSGSTFSLTQTLTGSGSNTGFGKSISMNKKDALVLVVGDPASNKVTAFTRASQTDSFANAFDLESLATLQVGELFGNSVSVNYDGELIAVGAPGRNSNAGATYTYVRQGNTWVTVSPFPLVAPNVINLPPANDFGTGVALGYYFPNLRPQNLIVGAPNTGGLGVCYQFLLDNSNSWVLLLTFQPTHGDVIPDPTIASFGFAVSSNDLGDFVLIGAPMAVQGDTNTGATFTHQETIPTPIPSRAPTSSKPSFSPTRSPLRPTRSPITPTRSPTVSAPSARPTDSPSNSMPTRSPTKFPTTSAPTQSPQNSAPSTHPTDSPTVSKPTRNPTSSPTTAKPSTGPTSSRPSITPSRRPTTSFPTRTPTQRPTQISRVALFVQLDHSGSMRKSAAKCREQSGGKNCLQLELEFLVNLVSDVVDQVGIDNFRLHLSTFTCINGRIISKVLTQPEITMPGRPDQIENAFKNFEEMGDAHMYWTCPSKGTNRIIKLMKTVEKGYPLAYVIVTDGRVNNQNGPLFRGAIGRMKRLLNFGVQPCAATLGYTSYYQLKSLMGSDCVAMFDSFSSMALPDFSFKFAKAMMLSQALPIIPAPTSSPTTPTTFSPSTSPTSLPTTSPTLPTFSPTEHPSLSPTPPTTFQPSQFPTKNPTTTSPSSSPSTQYPTKGPTEVPTTKPSRSPITAKPTKSPSLPTLQPSRSPKMSKPTVSPITMKPSFSPSISSTPSKSPTSEGEKEANSYSISNIKVVQTVVPIIVLLILACCLLVMLYAYRKRRMQNPPKRKLEGAIYWVENPVNAKENETSTEQAPNLIPLTKIENNGGLFGFIEEMPEIKNH